MKITVKHTYDLSDKEVKALKNYWKEVRDEGETFRDWLRSYHNQCGWESLEDKISMYGEKNENDFSNNV